MPDDVNLNQDAECLRKEAGDLLESAETLERNAPLVAHARNVANFLRQIPESVQASLQFLMEDDVATPTEGNETPTSTTTTDSPSDSTPTTGDGDTPTDPTL